MDFLKPYREIIPGAWDVPNEDYHELPGLSSTDIRNIHVSIDTYLMRKATPQKTTDSMLEGSALHDNVLLPDEFNDRWFTSNFKTKKAEGFKKDVEDNPDKGVLTYHQGHSLYEQTYALKNNPTINKILTSDTNLREVSMWHEEDGILMKIRPDLICDGVMYDLKTTSGSVTPKGFIKSVFQWKYHVQAAYYLYVANLIGYNIDKFIFICVERHPPYHTALYELNEDLLDEGRDFIGEVLVRWDSYKKGIDTWTGLEHGREVVTL